jgi:hypothetical protein
MPGAYSRNDFEVVPVLWRLPRLSFVRAAVIGRHLPIGPPRDRFLKSASRRRPRMLGFERPVGLGKFYEKST